MLINKEILDSLLEITIPPTPKLSCHLFGCFDANSGLSLAATEEEKKCDGEPFHMTVSCLLNQAAPSFDIVTIDATIKAFFDLHHVENEDGLLALVPTDDLPEKGIRARRISLENSSVLSCDVHYYPWMYPIPSPAKYNAQLISQA